MTRSTCCLIYHSAFTKREAVKTASRLALLVPGIRPATIVIHGPHKDRVSFRVVRDEFAATVESVISSEHTCFTVSAETVQSPDHTIDFILNIKDFIKRTGASIFPDSLRMIEAAA